RPMMAASEGHGHKQEQVMNDQFDELTKGLAQSVTRRGALKKFGVGLACTVLAALGLEKNARGAQQTSCLPSGSPCHNSKECCSGSCDHYKVRNGGVIQLCR